MTNFYEIQKIKEIKKMMKANFIVVFPLFIATLLIFYKNFHYSLALIVAALIITNAGAAWGFKKIQKDFSLYTKFDRALAVIYSLIILYALYNTNGLNSILMLYAVFGILSVSLFYEKTNAIIFLILFYTGTLIIGFAQISGHLPRFNPKLIIFNVTDYKTFAIWYAFWLYVGLITFYLGDFFRKSRDKQIQQLEEFLTMVSDMFTLTQNSSQKILYAKIRDPEKYGLLSAEFIDRTLMSFMSEEEYLKVMKRRKKAENIGIFEPTVLNVSFPKGNFVFQIFSGKYTDKYNLTMAVDITEDYNNKRKLEMQQKIIYSAYFASAIVHELNNVTTIFGLNFSLIEDKTVKDRVLSALARQKQIMQNFAAYSKGLASISDPAIRKKVNVYDLCNESIKFAKLVADKKDAVFSILCEDKELSIAGDHDYCLMALNNVVTNAAKAVHSINEPGKITIEISLSDAETPMVNISVSDNGPGIHKDALTEIFDVSKPKTGKNASSMGLGLLITKAIIKNYGGQISIESEINKGTTVKIQMPEY